MRNPNIKRDSFRTLVRMMPYVAHEGQTIPYRKMTNVAGIPYQRASDYCAELGKFCKFMGWPFLNSLVVSEKTCRPGSGFFDWKKENSVTSNLGYLQSYCWSYFKGFKSNRELSEHVLSGIDARMDKFLERSN